MAGDAFSSSNPKEAVIMYNMYTMDQRMDHTLYTRSVTRLKNTYELSLTWHVDCIRWVKTAP